MTRTINLGVVSASPLFATAALSNRTGVRLCRTSVQLTGATQAYLQFFTTSISTTTGLAVAPIGGASPVQSFVLVAGYESAELFQDNRPYIPGPVYVALSSTPATYTAYTQNSLIILEVEEFEQELPSGIQSTNASGASFLNVFTNAQAQAGTYSRLYDVFAVTTSNIAVAGSTTIGAYLMLFATDTLPATGTPAIENQVWAIPINTVAGVNINLNGGLLLNFGDEQLGGRRQTQQGGLLTGSNYSTSSTALSTAIEGCTICISSTPTTFTPLSAAVNLVARFI